MLESHQNQCILSSTIPFQTWKVMDTEPVHGKLWKNERWFWNWLFHFWWIDRFL